MATIQNDPRFRLGRALIKGGGQGDDDKGGPAGAINIFAALLEESRNHGHGETSLDAALCQFEYGNALFRAVVRRQPLDEDGDDGKSDCAVGGENKGAEEDKKPAAAAKKQSQRDIMAAAALKRSSADSSDLQSNKKAKISVDGSTDSNARLKDDGEVKRDSDSSEPDDSDDEDMDLALDMMDTAWEILLSHAAIDSPAEDGESKQLEDNQKWALDQIPRVIRCIGDLYSFRGEHANAVDFYIRAAGYREEAWSRYKETHVQGNGDGDTEMMTLEALQCQRHLVETYALIASELLSCPDGEDVVCRIDDGDDEGGGTSEAKAKGSNSCGRTLAKADDRVDYAQSHYELAREGLEEVLCRYGKMAAAKMNGSRLTNEKEDIGYLVMTVVDVGNMLAKENE